MNSGKTSVLSQKISIIMPAYNAEKYIEAAVRSVMAQTYPHWELLVLDDGSSDGTCAIVRQLMDEDNRIRLEQNAENRGVAYTRNRGLDLCDGSYVALLDCDDLWHADKLEKQLQLATDSQADIVYCSYGIVDEQGSTRCDDFIVPPQTDYREALSRSVISCSTALLSRRVAAQYRFRTDYYHEDLILWLEMLRDGNQARGVTQVLAQYRVSSGSRASNKFKSAVQRWTVIRHGMQEPFFSSVRAIVRFAWLAVGKYKKV